MGEVIELSIGENKLFAECPECGGKRWFIEISKDVEYESDIDFLLNMCSLICVDCKAEFEFNYGDLIIAEKEKG